MTSATPALEQQARTLAAGLYPHQVAGITFLLGRRRAILADDMGLGKTRQSVVAMMKAAPTGPWLVVCPASVKHNWEREIRLVEKRVPVVVVGKTPTPGVSYEGWVIINYDLLKRELGALLNLNFTGVVFDEAHFLKNHRAQRSQLARQLAETPQAPVIHVLTGTPLTNRPRDLFALLQLVHHPLGRSFLAFAKRYCDAEKNEYGHWITGGASNIPELSVQLQGIMLRRRKNEVLDLPAKQRTWIDLEVPAKVRDGVNAALTSFLDESRRTERGGRAGIAMMAAARRRLAVAKVAQTLEFVEGILEQDLVEKVVLFSCFTHATRRFAAKLGEQAVVVTGEVAAERRQALIDRFENDATVRVFIGQIHAAGVGINLTRARFVVFNDLDWVPANHWQAEDRLHRIGQLRTVHVTYMVGKGTLEEFVRSVLERKASLIDEIVEGRAIATDVDEDLLSGLRNMVQFLGSELDRVQAQGASAADTEGLLTALSAAWMEREMDHVPEVTRRALTPVSDAAIQSLMAVLGGPDRAVYHVHSSRGAGAGYRVEVEGSDVTCDCKGFVYRWMCRHVRDLKTALAAGQPLPAGYEELERGSA